MSEHVQSPTPVLDVSNRGSNRGSSQKSDPGSLPFSCLHTRAISWRHLSAPAGVATPRSRPRCGGEDCLSVASSAALTFGTGAKAPVWPRPVAHGFGSFCRNKRTSACRGRNPASTFFLSVILANAGNQRLSLPFLWKESKGGQRPSDNQACGWQSLLDLGQKARIKPKNHLLCRPHRSADCSNMGRFRIALR